MSNTEAALVGRYLQELEEALATAPTDRRREIVDEVRSHIDEEIRALGHPPDEIEIRRILDRLGDPEAIAGDVPLKPPPARSARLGFLEVAALILLLIGGFVIPFIGWIAGVILLWVSPAWDTKRKLLGTFVVPLGLAAPFYLMFFAPAGSSCTAVETFESGPRGRRRLLEDPGQICESTGMPRWILTLIMLGLLFAAIASAVHLGRHARKTIAAQAA